MKSEPDVFSIDDLCKSKTTWWEGVRNYQARNFMMKEMTAGDQVLFYHSNAEPSGIAGLAKVCQEAKPDLTQFDKKSDYYDAKSSKENPRWHCVQIQFVEKFPEILPLELLKKQEPLSDMQVLKKGQRLSVQPVTEKEFQFICRHLSKKRAPK